MALRTSRSGRTTVRKLPGRRGSDAGASSVISQVTVTDKQKFQDYLAKTRSIAATYGAKPIAVGAQPKTLSGEANDHQMVFVIEFETMEKLDAWHNSEEYQAIVSLREAGSDQRMVAYEAWSFPQS